MSNLAELEEEVTTMFEHLSKENNIEYQINEFEQNWTKWSIDDTINWFKYIIYCTPAYTSKSTNNRYESDDSVQTYSDNDDDNDNNYAIDDAKNQEEKEMEQNENGTNDLDFIKIKNNLVEKGFVSKMFLQGMEKKDLINYGFKNPLYYRLIYKKIDKLIDKYPVKKRKGKQKDKSKHNGTSMAVNNTDPVEDANNMSSMVEGYPDDTHC